MKTIREAGAALATTPKPAVWRSKIIEAGWGASGYYSDEVLERDGPGTWPQGTQVFLDHPGASESVDRPERSVRDLAGKIVSTPAMESDGLYAEIEMYPHVAPIVEAMAGDIGLSIRAGAEVEAGEVDGQSGWIIARLAEGQSVDLVTKAGAGGKLVSLMESQRQQVKAAEVLPGGGTVDDLRNSLRVAVQAAHGDAYIETFTDMWVVYHRWDDEGPSGLHQQTYTTDQAGAVTLTGSPVQVTARTEYVPVAPTNVPADPAGSTEIATESRRGNIMATVQIEETALADLRAGASRVADLEEAAKTATERAETAENAVKKAEVEADAAAADRIIAEAGVEFGKWEHNGIMSNFPLTESNRLDVDKFKERVTEAATEKAAASGAGQPAGVGSTRNVDESDYSEDDLNQALGIVKGA